MRAETIVDLCVSLLFLFLHGELCARVQVTHEEGMTATIRPMFAFVILIAVFYYWVVA